MVRVLVCAMPGSAKCKARLLRAAVDDGHVLVVPLACRWSRRALRSPQAGRLVSPPLPSRYEAMVTRWMHSSELGVHERPVPARASSLTRTAVMEGILLKRREPVVVVAADFVEDEGDEV